MKKESIWTPEKIEQTLRKKRVLKPLAKRKPKTYLTNASLAKLVSQRTGFVYDNVKEVVDDLMDIMYEQVLLGNRVQIPKMGSFFLAIKAPYVTNISLKCYREKLKEHHVPPRFDLRLTRNETTLNFLKQREVTEEELDTAYISDSDIKQKEQELVIPDVSQNTRKM